MSFTNPYLQALPELLSAKQKLGDLASFNDARKLDLSGFKTDPLEPYSFRQQLEKVFHLKLSDAELGALVTLFDKNGDGLISHKEFFHDFFQLGKERRDVKMLIHKNRRKRQDDQLNEMLDELLSVIAPPTSIELPVSWTEEHEVSAGKKILKAALAYDGKRFLLKVSSHTVSLCCPACYQRSTRNLNITILNSNRFPP